MRRCLRLLVDKQEFMGDIAAGRIEQSLLTLNSIKKTADSDDHLRNVDLLRSLCFLQRGDSLHARQALIEEVRNFPSNREARRLLLHVNNHVERLLDPPPIVTQSEPLFHMLYEGLKGHTMLTWSRLFSLYARMKQLCEEDVVGDVVECGTAGGGSIVLLACVCKHFSKRPRNVFACDTFRGMPEPHPVDVLVDQPVVRADDTNWSTGTCSSSQLHVLALAEMFDVKIRTIPGLFEDTLDALPVAQIAMLHADGDWYESTKSILVHLYPKVTKPGGVVQVDDYYYWDGCRKAADEVVGASRLVAVDGNAAVILHP